MINKYNYDSACKALNNPKRDIVRRTVKYDGGEVSIFCIIQTADREILTRSIIEPIVKHCKDNNIINCDNILDSVIYADDCRISNEFEHIEDEVLSGMTVILFSNDDRYIVINIKKTQHRDIPTPQLTYTSRGPQDCFCENMDTNLSLVRYRIKDENLVIDKMVVGRRTKTRICLLHIDGITNKKIVEQIKNRINDIDVDGISDSGELQTFLLENKYNLFPNTGLCERSDYACHSILEGKVVILVEGSCIALVAPKVFCEYMYSSDDRYDNKFFGAFCRILRYLSLFLSFTLSSTFVAVTSYNTDVLPGRYAILLAKMRADVPLNAIAGAFLMEIIIELLREALIRVPKQIGSAVGIVGAIIIGEAAISAGIFSPLMLIIGSVELMASFVIPDYSLVNSFRVIKFGLLFATGIFGYFGFTAFLTLLLSRLVSKDVFGVPFMAPLAPFDLYDYIRMFYNNTAVDKLRPKYLKTEDKIRNK